MRSADRTLARPRAAVHVERPAGPTASDGTMTTSRPCRRIANARSKRRAGRTGRASNRPASRRHDFSSQHQPGNQCNREQISHPADYNSSQRRLARPPVLRPCLPLLPSDCQIPFRWSEHQSYHQRNQHYVCRCHTRHAPLLIWVTTLSTATARSFLFCTISMAPCSAGDVISCQ